MESGAILHIEVFVEQTRYALEKLVRESGTGKSRNDESSRSAIIKVSDKRTLLSKLKYSKNRNILVQI